ncbi:MAG: cysteine desulfurase family protein [Candidatus Melainabacteria bacterium]|nr:cysteine desulfurase family protein [Candidatus Melainabacteria bacterium]
MSIYFDNSATTKVRQEVVDAMMPYLMEEFGNPSSIHSFGRNSHKAISHARKQVADLLGCSPTEIYFSPCGTMSNNVAILGRARFVKANGLGQHLITTQIEHPSVLGPSKLLEAEGWKVTYLPVCGEGFLNPEDLRKAITKETSIISVMWANNEIGTVQPIAELGQVVMEEAAKHGTEIFFHTDAVQASAKVLIDLSSAQGVSALSISGHKFHAPKGIGGLFLRKGVNIMPITFGGGQEKALLPGTEGLANVVALGKAAELARLDLEECCSRLKELAQYLIAELSQIEGVQITGTRDLDRRLPGHVSITVENAEGEALVMQLDMKGVCASSASACHSGVIEPSHVLSALQLPCSRTKGSLRLSLGRYNTKEECDKAVEVMRAVFRPKPASKKTLTAGASK